MSHTCHATNCSVEVPPTMWGCRRHWFMVPREIRDRIWQTYRPGQCDDRKPSSEYLHAARAAVVAVAVKEHIQPDVALYDTFLAALCTCERMSEHCEKSTDNIHSYEWWDGTGPCRFCMQATCPACDATTGEHL